MTKDITKLLKGKPTISKAKTSKVTKPSTKKKLTATIKETPITQNTSTKKKVTINDKTFEYEEKMHSSTCRILGTHGVRFQSKLYSELMKTHKENFLNNNNNGHDTKKLRFQIASFDLDDTLIQTKSGFKFGKSADDWKFKYPEIQEKGKLTEWIMKANEDCKDDETTTIPIMVIFTNQGGVTNNHDSNEPKSKSLLKLLTKLQLILDSSPLAEVPTLIYASTKKSKKDLQNGVGSDDQLHSSFRKPGIGMFEQLKMDLGDGVGVGVGIDGVLIDMEKSFYVGDAAGRKSDFSDSDKKFAENVGLKFYTPEEFFV
ncbi:unnamed protein product [Ambrosiozyma monospora]|uniref:Unnamed protein product n=1 Tax=Ambrosiozyma monospora TaxID=43982 RepID=A0A9W7DDM8_AMBMO|nr:unnamed protein product [Ambrosiozyma monospora]